MTVPKGGRGHKAPYETTHVRIPVAIKEVVEELSIDYKTNGYLTRSKDYAAKTNAIELAQKILKQKKSAKVSMEKLLTGLFGEEITL